jgi:hypothetical protein
MGAAQNGLSSAPTPFNWEMGQFYQSGTQGTLNFVQDLGTTKVPNPF